ncbi:MAG TPA: hypothetical protein PK605_00255 [Ignavibacteria bacterium]|nr:hypothetical protein [Bacteroidota bacterium]HRE10788.1 hypothetical protein [Ignavibacteria bacterium]HRF65969.1 hypothetical protein [Ignavibacteria bacterium]HRJ02810.1 hypothetical protein [Ignavibacteria bacterium]HRJ84368.1 hypothetical protein [Ignavibacteria bacterium]
MISSKAYRQKWNNKRNKKKNAKAVYSITAKEKNSRGLERHFFLNDPDDTDLEWFAIDNNLKDVKYQINRIEF